MENVRPLVTAYFGHLQLSSQQELLEAEMSTPLVTVYLGHLELSNVRLTIPQQSTKQRNVRLIIPQQNIIKHYYR